MPATGSMYKVPGGPNPAAVAQQRANATLGAANTSTRYQWSQPVRRRNNAGNLEANPNASLEFPIVMAPKDSYDDTANMKMQYAESAMGSNWVVPFEQADADFLMRKRDAQEKALFDTWIQQKYDLSDPAQNMMLQNIAPELYARREEVIDATQDMVSKYAKMRLRGAKDISDLQFEWLVETGRLELPKGPIWDPGQWRAQQQGKASFAAVAADAASYRADIAFNAGRYKAGLFSPLKWLTQDTLGLQQDTSNYFNVVGVPGQIFNNYNVPAPSGNYKNYWGTAAPYPQPQIATTENERTAYYNGGMANPWHTDALGHYDQRPPYTP